MKKIMLVAGARPNFMKIAPILREIEKDNDLKGILVHTGQHYDKNMSDTFFNSLGIKAPDNNLEVGSGSHAIQTANIMVEFEKVCEREEPDVVLVVGDVNSTIAAGLVAKKQHKLLVHVEAGLRSFDREMPEEINRMATDSITDVFFTTEPEGSQNLLREGHAEDHIHFVGHVMIDNLFYQLARVGNGAVSEKAKKIKAGLPGKFACLTMHRPSNVDSRETLEPLLRTLCEIGEKIPVVFPCHPRTRSKIEAFNLEKYVKNLPENGGKIDSGLLFTEPLDYNDFLYLWKDAALVLTDSGGIQEETTALKIPCITLRENTERPVTVSIGSNEIAGRDSAKILALSGKALDGRWKKSGIPELWDGKASERIVEILRRSR